MPPKAGQPNTATNTGKRAAQQVLLQRTLD